eukprot:3294805-Amphidinium_carterae.1
MQMTTDLKSCCSSPCSWVKDPSSTRSHGVGCTKLFAMSQACQDAPKFKVTYPNRSSSAAQQVHATPCLSKHSIALCRQTLAHSCAKGLCLHELVAELRTPLCCIRCKTQGSTEATLSSFLLWKLPVTQVVTTTYPPPAGASRKKLGGFAFATTLWQARSAKTRHNDPKP